MKKQQGPKVLIVDIETAPIIAHVWGLWDQNIGLNQIQQDWHLLSWSAKWLGDSPSKIIYMDQRNEKDITNDKRILQSLWKLLDEADVVLGQNSKAFDTKKINSRFLFHGFQPPSSYKHIDILLINKKHFGHTSNKLEYISDKYNKKFKKLKHKKFPGHEMWNECLKGNKTAWKAMEKYNKHDVLATEEAYRILMPWDNTIDFSIYTKSLTPVCPCGSKSFTKNGYAYTASGKFERYKCSACGSETRSRYNLLDRARTQRLRTAR